MSKALFAAGCFWGVQFYFDQLDGVESTLVGYTGGYTDNPTYDDVCYRNTGHTEAVELTYDESKVSYETLVRQFLYLHDPTQKDGQGIDIGDQYRSAIFYLDDAQKVIAEKVILESAANYSHPIVTEVTKASEFYPAEDYHQKYAERTGRGMCHKPFRNL